jgi:hypothetical protein
MIFQGSARQPFSNGLWKIFRIPAVPSDFAAHDALLISNENTGYRRRSTCGGAAFPA